MLKPYHKRTEIATCTLTAAHVVEGQRDAIEHGPRLSNSVILKNLKGKLDHLSGKEQGEMEQLLLKFQEVFSDIPSTTTCNYHDVDVEEAAPVKQYPYRVNPIN